MHRKKLNKSVIVSGILFLFFIAGLSLVLYPSISNYWNSLRQTKEIASYEENLSAYTSEQYEEMWNAAVSYNEKYRTDEDYILSDERQQDYDNVLNIGKDGVMGYIEIPSIDVSLPIYHGTSNAVLQTGVGHLEWTSLPTGGEGTHCVISGHRGLPGSTLFTDLDKLVEGDIFMLKVLDQVLTYEVDQILIVEPEDTKDLQIVEGEDYCTLVTCTPYGINTQRLLVRGHRIENTREAAQISVTSDAIQIDTNIITPIVFIPVLVILLAVVFIFDKKIDPALEEDDDEPDEEQKER